MVSITSAGRMSSFISVASGPVDPSEPTEPMAWGPVRELTRELGWVVAAAIPRRVVIPGGSCPSGSHLADLFDGEDVSS